MGIQSKRSGDSFEKLFVHACQIYDFAITRIPDGCRQLSNKRLIRIKSPWDFVISYQGHTALIDTKTVQGDTFPYSSITPHQVKALCDHANHGAMTGYVVWLRKTDRVIFIPAFTLHGALQSKNSGSFSEKNPGVIYLGGITFDARLIFDESECLNTSYS